MEHSENIARAVEVGWLWLIPLFPLVGSALNLAFGWKLQKRYGKRAVHFIAVGAMLLSCVVAELAFWKMVAASPADRFFENHLWTMWQSGSLHVDLSFGLDPLGMMMTMIVTHVATLIHIYSIGYMADEPDYWRFFMWLNLFVFSMLLLVMGSNFLVMFFGWEGVGLCSYGLIAFWYTDVEKAKAGMKAFVVNRFGDFGFVIGLFILFWSLSGVWAKDTNHYIPERGLSGRVMGTEAEPPRVAPSGIRLGPTVEFRELRNQISDESTGMAERLKEMDFWGFPVLALVCILFFVGATGKSAQIPLYVWLPDAMAGPTPVSALIHAATMVTAGVYMVARLNFLFALSPAAMTVVAVVGVLTAIFAASIGFFQYDIKKVLAYSTVSQLGFMFIGVGVGAYWAGVFHLMTHAFFKACLFLGSGSVILACHHEQDMRKMGGLREYTPITRWTYLAACWAIAGFPWAAGFYSKDEILWKAWTAEGLSADWIGPAVYIVGAIAALGTSFYMFRSYYMTFTGAYRGAGGHHDKERQEDPHTVPAHAHADDALHAPTHAAAAHDVKLVPDAHAVAHDAHAHGGTPHESPNSMTWVLAILAFAAVVAGVIFGWPASWGTGHEPLLERWLAPSLPAAEHVKFAEPGRATEYEFQFIGFAIAAVGWFAARVLYVDAKSPIPARLKAMFPRVWSVVFNKYYVDELYDATVVRAAIGGGKGYVFPAIAALAAAIIAIATDAHAFDVPSYLVHGTISSRLWLYSGVSRLLVIVPVTAFAYAAAYYGTAAACYFIDQKGIDALVNFMGWLGRAVAYFDAAIDKYVVDGAVNGLADLTIGGGRALRRVQTGHIQAYLFGALGGGIALVILLYIEPNIVTAIGQLLGLR
ncbi:MAG TPA: NADH-quinone oxidoreductase subunit L [Myxococcales bacterium]|nr:NADH-quinone oxidoreductase subunit L [Myxococcales bacterium]